MREKKDKKKKKKEELGKCIFLSSTWLIKSGKKKKERGIPTEGEKKKGKTDPTHPSHYIGAGKKGGGKVSERRIQGLRRTIPPLSNNFKGGGKKKRPP